MLSNPDWEKKRLFSLDRPSLAALAYLLRHKEQWPEGFAWDYTYCDQCAMGLARTLWEKDYNPYIDRIDHAKKYMKSTFGLKIETIEDIFEGVGWDEKVLETVTPEIVADKIDTYLQTKE